MHPSAPQTPFLRTGLALCATVALLGSSVRAENLAIVVAKSAPVEGITSDELARIFRCEETAGPGGIKWEIFSRERTSSERETVLKVVYHMSEAQYNRFFMQAVFAGKLNEAPRVIPSASAMKAIAANRPGAVTYILASQVDDSVKAIRIDGLLPSDPGYPLKVGE